MRLLLIVAALMAVFTGCSNIESEPIEKTTENAVIEVAEQQQLQELPFESGQGRAILIFEGSIVDCIIYAKGLKPEEKYRISLVGDNGASSGVMFGPKENVQIRVGTLEGEVTFKPNSEGELFVSMRNPIRILTSATKELIFKIESEKRKVIIKTVPFLVNKKGG